ncbi:RNA-directed DNA polymerase from mobile element jockey [Trichonephila clavipes]|nr:RNA-directed DNA polymerase from mobile element jockey [Trichonephila clavipes]
MKGLIPSGYECPKCKMDMRLVDRKGTIDGFQMTKKILGKVAEKIILTRMYHHVDSINLIIPEQHGFQPNLLTSRQLLRVVETIRSGFRKQKSTGAVFVDIQKALDRVWGDGLIFKLINYNFPPHMIKLISSYLFDRNFSLRINAIYSSHRPTEAGVAQGTLISPLLFNIYVNDIPKHDNTNLCMFADDTAVLTTHKEPKLIARALNIHILDLEDWFSKWKIALSVEKTEAVFFTRKHSLTYPRIYLHNEQIPWSQHTKYLANRRAPMTARTPAGSDPDHGDGTPSENEVIPLAQHPIRELPLARKGESLADLHTHITCHD